MILVALYLPVVALGLHLFAPTAVPPAVVVAQAVRPADTAVVAAAVVVEAVEVGNDVAPTELHLLAADRADHEDLQAVLHPVVVHFPTTVGPMMWDTEHDTVDCHLANHHKVEAAQCSLNKAASL